MWARAVLLLFVGLSAPTVLAAGAWTSSVKKDYDRPEKWEKLVSALKEKHFNYGAVIGAERILRYFTDLKSKQFAFDTLAGSVDAGYPFSLSNDFFVGDLELVGKDNNSQSYNLYKATMNDKKGMKKWAEIYFGRVDKDNFAKYSLYKGLEASAAKNPDEAIKNLEQALSLAKGPENATVAQKAARTLARVLYEQGKYKESLDIYESYLLHLNPVQPSDWMEAAWCLYRLGRLDDAIGEIYNLEGLSENDSIYLEKYILRALVYRERCDSASTAKLNQTFEQVFLPTLEGIKVGNSLKGFPLLKRIYLGTSDYYRTQKVLKEIEAEQKRLKELPSDVAAMADFMYTSEIKSIEKSRDTFEDEALDAAARNLVILGESLHFLQFDVAREKFNPDKVFAPTPPPTTSAVVDKGPESFEIHWLQWGDFWRDERVSYRGIVKNKCQ